MRAGTIFLFLVLIVMGFGFLLSSNMYMLEELTAAQRQVNEITEGKKAIEDQLNQAVAEIANLKRQNEVLAQEKQALEGQLRKILGDYSLVKNQNAELQDQIDRMKKLNSIIADLTEFDPKSVILALFVPLLSVSLVSNFLIYRNGKLHNRSGAIGKPNRTFTMQVTKEEMTLIRQMRRKQ